MAILGFQYGDECVCDIEMAESTEAAACDMPCVGDIEQMCGGNKSMNLYQY